MALHDEIARRRTFAVIAHPDAGIKNKYFYKK